MSFGEQLTKARKKKYLTQSQVGKALNISAAAISRWEQGDRLPNVAYIPNLCKVLGCDANFLFED